jgi:RNA 2',3'-cyclic 3'-phosphodiesterase
MKHYARLFVAAPLPETVITALQHYLPGFEVPGVRIVPEENWHLTLHFIGNVPHSQVPEISAKLPEIAAGFNPFHLKLMRVSPGPNKKTPRLVWAQFAEDKSFEKLVRATTLSLGAKVQNQHPIPHVTLARLSKENPPRNLPVIPASENLTLEVKELALWESELRQPHPRYSVLQQFPLGV